MDEDAMEGEPQRRIWAPGRGLTSGGFEWDQGGRQGKGEMKA